MMPSTAAPLPTSPDDRTAPDVLFARTPPISPGRTPTACAPPSGAISWTPSTATSPCSSACRATRPSSSSRSPLRHPLIFYFGHTATFFVNKLLLARLIDQRLDHRLESILAVGVDEMSWDDLDDTHYDWPPVAEVRTYRDRVRALVLDLD